MEYEDQMNRKLVLEKIPQRIISLVPSQTELLVHLGLGDRVVGLTKFCVHPKGFKKNKAVIGGTKNFHFDNIEILNPDLIIGNKEENYKEGIERLTEKYPVWMSDIFNLEDAMEMMKALGDITGKKEEAVLITDKIRIGFEQKFPFKGTAVYLIWQDPIIVAGKYTFIDDLLKRVGYENLIGNERYPEITNEEITALDPDYILLSSEPYPFKKTHIAVYEKMFSKAKVQCVDGEMFSWYGSRLVKAVNYFKSL